MIRQNFYSLYGKLAGLTVTICTLLRIILLFNSQTIDLHLSFFQWLGVFSLGALNDVLVLTIAMSFLWLYLYTIKPIKYSKPWGYIILSILAGSFLYVTFANTIFNEYGSVAPEVASGILAFWTSSFAFRLFLPKMRNIWSRSWFAIFLLVYVGVIYFNAVSEWFFWSEFGVRYNFIAVDYLVYTHEVIGNIMESYPIIPMVSALLIITLISTAVIFRIYIFCSKLFENIKPSTLSSLPFILFVVISLFILPKTAKLQDTSNVYYNELQANGVYKFYQAFVNNKLDYMKFYQTLPNEEAERILNEIYSSTKGNLRHIEGKEEKKYNIVLVSLESLSGNFMNRYGNNDIITPFLDSLANKSLVFDELFAAGNRTVRGLEALTLSLPPCPGQSIIKQPNNGGKFSTGALLKSKGYDVTYYYGGDSYFDNMETFFKGNGYDIVDKKNYSPEEITFSNIWGVCDEDSYAKALKDIDKKYEAGKPFFAHIMSVSNHRPYTYPDGRISIPSTAKSRRGGVLYSDYSLSKFIHAAENKPWFDNTIFVIVSDHCASSAGNTALPLEKYHIPAMIYAPGIVGTKKIDKVCSQIDLMPTVFAIMGLDYDSRFYGDNILDENFKERAFIATYQSLGYLEDSTFVVISPIRRAEAFKWSPTKENRYALIQEDIVPEDLLKKTISLYQTSTGQNN